MGHQDYVPRRVPIAYNPGFSISNPPRGYNQQGIQQRLRASRNSLIDTYHTESFARYSPRPVNLGNLLHWENQTERARMIWDMQPELRKIPITGKPDQFSIQYVLYTTAPPTDGGAKKPVKQSIPQRIRNTFFAKPVQQSNG